MPQDLGHRCCGRVIGLLVAGLVLGSCFILNSGDIDNTLLLLGCSLAPLVVLGLLVFLGLLVRALFLRHVQSAWLSCPLGA
ncbi:hypothetical protein DFH07DRAFT_823873 [Mycena maculata]|uniref:Uncharacterized protein n=1 Tax=Mycena maculata TaxID=230809 RepID=A0AAD7J0J6_9AGAR|nr:hypothetical protein DFH07DRAFT_823873 [Mycena maculata]